MALMATAATLGRLLLRRALHAGLVLAGASVVIFASGELLPGDAAEILLRQSTDAPAAERVAELRHALALDDGIPHRFVGWVRSTAGGDLGRSWRTGEPVAHLVAQRAGATLSLALAAFVVVVLVSLGVGWSGLGDSGRRGDAAVRLMGVVTAALPSFWLATLLVDLFGVRLGWLPFVGRGGLAHHILPAIALGLGVGVAQGRVLRSLLRELMARDFVRFAMACGLSPRAVWVRRLLPNALPPMLTLWGVSLGQLLSGAFIVESVFSWPGLGRLTVEAVVARDLPVLQGSVLAVTLVYVSSNEVVRAAQAWLDPRLAASNGASGD